MLARAKVADLKFRHVAWTQWKQHQGFHVTSLGVVGCALLTELDTAWTLRLVFRDTAIALVSVWIVDRTARAVHGTGWLRWRPLVYLGTISYGMYLMHLFIVPGLRMVSPRLDPGMGLWSFLLVTGLTTGVASLSWYFLERPCNSLKRHATYRSAAREAAQVSPVVLLAVCAEIMGL